MKFNIGDTVKVYCTQDNHLGDMVGKIVCIDDDVYGVYFTDEEKRKRPNLIYHTLDGNIRTLNGRWYFKNELEHYRDKERKGNWSYGKRF